MFGLVDSLICVAKLGLIWKMWSDPLYITSWSVACSAEQRLSSSTMKPIALGTSIVSL